jgi:predicted nucleic-acid-binding protein
VGVVLIGVDTNVLLRWLGGDPHSGSQTAQAVAALSPHGRVHVNLVVLAELAWLLDQKLRHARAESVGILRSLLAHPQMVVDAHETVKVAVDAYELGGAGFNDHLIGALNAAAGCAMTLTFDKAAAKGIHFTAVT